VFIGEGLVINFFNVEINLDGLDVVEVKCIIIDWL